MSSSTTGLKKEREAYAELSTLIDTVIKKGKLLYTGEALGLGKTGDVNVNWAGRQALKEISFLLEEYPQLTQIPKEIQLLLKGEAYEDIFEDLKKSVLKIAIKEPWQMTRKEFFANPPKEVDIWLVEGKPPHRGKIGSTPDFFGGPPTRGYRVANTVTPFDTAHKNIVKHALEEGKPVPPEVLAGHPELARKEPWRMTRQEFTNIEKGVVVELLPMPFSGRRERAVIHPSPKKKGYIQWSLIILNPKTGVWEPGSDIQFPDRQALRRHLGVIHRQEVKQAIGEGKPIPQEVLRDYPDLIKKLMTEHVS